MRRILLALPVLALVLAGCRFTGDNGSSLDCSGLPTATVTAVATGTCTWTASPLPTTTTTTAPPTTTTSSTPPSAGFPTPATTGAAATTAFTMKPSGTTVNTPNQVIDGWHVTGALLVNAPGVTIKNSWIEGYLDNENTALGSARMTVTDTTIGNPSKCDPLPGLGEHDYSATRVRIIGQGDGFRVSGSNVTVTDSFVQTCDDPNNHDDALQIYCPSPLPQPCQNVAMNHNTLSNAATRNFTAPLFGGSDPGGSNGQLANSSFVGNLLWGGVFSIDLLGKNLDIEHNRVATNQWVDPDGSACAGGSTGVKTAQGCAYSGWVWGASATSCSTVTWSDNRAVTKDNNWQPTGPGTALNCA